MPVTTVDFGGQCFTVHSAADDQLGECPTWRENDGALYWIDVRKPCLHRLIPETGARRSWAMPEMVGSFVFRRDGRILLALETGLGVLDTETDQVDWALRLHAADGDLRFNDGCCDRQGRFWVGSMDNFKRGAVGHLYRYDERGLVKMADDVVVPNSLCFSPDGRTMYFSDEREPVIWAFDLAKDGTLSNRREFARMASGGAPDGATVDAEGYLWSAQYGAARIDRFSPDGTLDKSVLLPVTQPTSIAFGGMGMRQLFITTARQKLDADTLATQPLAGSVLSLDVGVAGIAETSFAS
jgi:sugar lactone lactonase YvrE